jgi:hypothetical protein
MVVSDAEQRARHLAGVDAALELVVCASSADLDERLARLAAAVLTHVLGTPQTVANAAEVFEESLSREAERFLAICLLRLLAARRDVFEDRWLRVESTKVFDETLSEDLYPLAKVKRSDQGHEKLDALADLVPQAEGFLHEAINDVAQEVNFAAARGRLMSTIKSARVAPFILPFVPRSLFPGRQLEDLLTAVQEFESTQGEQLVSRYRDVCALAETYVRDAQAVGTTYAENYVAELAVLLQDRVRGKYDQSAIGQPAHLRLAAADKRYPLHLDGSEIQVLIDVVNEGPGYAFDVTLTIEEPVGLEMFDTTVHIGTLSPRAVTIALRSCVLAGDQKPTLRLRGDWRDAAGNQREATVDIKLQVQDPTVDWEATRKSDPYALEPVGREDELVGRGEMLAALESMMTGNALSSVVLRGQKRVGKTSIARTLQSQLAKSDVRTVTAYLEVGPYGSDSVVGTIAQLLPEICHAFKSALPDAADDEIPSFADGSAAPLIQFMRHLRERAAGANFVVILDEFDELPPLLFGADDVARSFFMTIRAVSSEPDVGVILIGGEKMEFALALHGDALNKFNDQRVDYVGLRDNLGDFAELVRAPGRGVLDFTDTAVSRLHEETEGHPYFTKMICRTIWQGAVASRDAHITVREVDSAIRDTVDGAPTTSFQHLWSDGIQGTSEEQGVVSLERRKLFISLAEVLRRKTPAPEDEIVAEARAFEITRGQVAALLRESIQRDVLVEPSPHAYSTRIPFFARWLREYGPLKIGAQLGGGDVVQALKKREEELRVTSLEIKRVTERWGSYRGKPITPEDVRAWLDQFIGPDAQRLMFKILEGLRFYSGQVISEKLSEVHSLIVRGELSRGQAGRQLRRSDVLVSYLDGAGKSGPEIARKYRTVSGIVSDNIVEQSALRDAISNKSPRALVFVDDFVSTGRSASEGVARLPEAVIELLGRQSVRVGFVCIAGFEDGLKFIQNAFKAREIRARVHAGDTLSEGDRVFSQQSTFFSGETERTRAEEIVARQGKQLERSHPLGYENAQAAIVFDGSCPNNTLPILWAERGDWIPLFPRR